MDTESILKKAEQINEEYNFLNVINKDPDSDTKHKGKLSGIAVTVKDCICVKGMESTAGSRILENYKPLFDASVIKKIKEEGGFIIGKTSQDEFGFGSFNTNVGIGFKIPKNPFDKSRVCGGSSGGSAGFTQKADFPHISIAESTGGSIVAPASFCGVYGLCPTYGRVSRYGLIDYANSLDKIGPMAKSVRNIALALEVISGYDPKDSTSLDKPVPEYTKFLDKGVRGMKIGILKESFSKGVDPKVKDLVLKAVKFLKEKGADIEDVSLPFTEEYGIPSYYIIALSEASTNLAKYCGMRYGKASENVSQSFNEYFSGVRSRFFGEETKRRIILGTFARMSGFRDAFYLKALKVRTKIIDEFKMLFKKYDLLISPTMPILPPKLEDIKKLTPIEMYMMDVLTVGPNLAGLPHMNVPVGLADDLPVGMLLTADHLHEEKIIQAASVFDSKDNEKAGGSNV